MNQSNPTHNEQYLGSYLEYLDANSRGAPDTINVSARGGPGPDYLGQESVDVDGHSCDRPGVRWRRPEENPDDPRIERMDTGRELPVLLSSDMSADPIEGTQGTYTQIVESDCARCGYDRIRETVHTLPGERKRVCNACGAIQDGRTEHGYRMPQTASDRVDRLRESGVKLGTAGRYAVYDMEPDTGMGPYLELINGDSHTMLRKATISKLYHTWMGSSEDLTVEAIRDDLVDELSEIDRVLLAAGLLPDGVTICEDTEEGDE